MRKTLSCYDTMCFEDEDFLAAETRLYVEYKILPEISYFYCEFEWIDSYDKEEMFNVIFYEINFIEKQCFRNKECYVFEQPYSGKDSQKHLVGVEAFKQIKEMCLRLQKEANKDMEFMLTKGA